MFVLLALRNPSQSLPAFPGEPPANSKGQTRRLIPGILAARDFCKISNEARPLTIKIFLSNDRFCSSA